MSLAILIAAYQESDDAGGPLRAALPLAGRTLIERQARLARAAGATRLVILVERLPAALLAAFDRLRADGFALTIARSAVEAGEAVDAHAPLLFMADGFLGDERQLRQMAALDAPALAIVPDAGPAGGDARFERIDGQSRWAGLALIDGALLRDTAAMLRDWDPQSTLLRRAIQSGARAVALADLSAAPFTIVEGSADLAEIQTRLLAQASEARGGWISHYLLGPVERAVTRWLMPTRAAPLHLDLAAAFLTALGALSFARDILWLGLLLLILATPLDGIAERLARLRMQESRAGGWRQKLLLLLSGAAFLALGISLARNGGDWGTIVTVVTTIAFLLALRFELPPRGVRGQIFLAERKGMAWLLVPFAATGLWTIGLVMLLVYAAGSFFWTQRAVRRPTDRQGTDPQD